MSNNPKVPHIEPIPLYPLGHSESIKVYENKSDTEIWNAFNNGDENAFNYIYRRYVVILFRYGRQVFKDQNHIQDCIQNIFIDLRRKRGNLSEVQSINAYLLKILYRELIRKTNNGKETVNPSPEKMQQSFSIEFSQETKIIDLEDQKESSYRIQTALSKLTCRQRQAILLLYEEGMSYKEIAIAMDFNEVKSARKLIYRALISLKSSLDKN